MRFHKLLRLSSVVCVFYAFWALSFFGQASWAAPKLPAVKSGEQLQDQTIRYITEKAGRPITLPSYPANSLLSWSFQSYQNAGEDKRRLYAAVGQQLLVARVLLTNKDLQQRRRGLRLVHNANFKVAVRLRDAQLSAQMFDGFVMPYLDAAITGKGTLSRARLLQDAASVYRLAGEKNKQAEALRKLIAAEENDKDTDGADWGRVKLADVLADQGFYQEAADQLEAVKSSNMSGSRTRISDLEAKAKAKAASKEKTQK